MFGGGKQVDDPQTLVKKGMQAFRDMDVEKSLEYFDAALEKDPRLEPYLWQKGLSLYYGTVSLCIPFWLPLLLKCALLLVVFFLIHPPLTPLFSLPS